MPDIPNEVKSISAMSKKLGALKADYQFYIVKLLAASQEE
jgi:hypothetical protein